MSGELLIWLFQTGEPLHIDTGNNRPMRGMNLANSLVSKGHRVVFWSSDFNHLDKRFRGRADEAILLSEKLEIRLLPSRGYQRNIGLARLLDHALLALNLRRRLRQESLLPDVAFVGYPPIETAYVLSRWLSRANVPVLLDVKDQWPVIFNAALPRQLKFLGPLIFWPYYYLARETMRRVTGISAMADGFLEWALEFSGKTMSDRDAVFPLTTPAGEVTENELESAGRWWDGEGVINNRTQRLYFVGSFSSAFDFRPVQRAAQTAMERNDNLQFVLCGDGTQIDQVKSMMKDLNNVIFPGWIDRPRIESLASRCIASIAPYKSTPDFIRSIPNKVVDSLALGLPILSPLQGEVARLIDGEKVGLQYREDAALEEGGLYRVIKMLGEDPNLQISMSSNAQALYNARFSFARVYGDLVSHLERLVASSNQLRN